MKGQRLLPAPIVATPYGEPWRVGRGVLVTDARGVPHVLGGGETWGNRAYYGGTMVAESITRPMATRAADCVNFCAGVEFRPGSVYLGGLLDVLDALETLHTRLPEPRTPVVHGGDREYFRLWRDVDELLSAFGRGSTERRLRREVAS